MTRPSGVRCLALALVLAACHPLPPPPVFAPHAGTQPEEQGAITAMVVVGAVTEMMGSEGWGIALRVERQETDRTTIGGELTGGRGGGGEYEDGTSFRQSLLGVRAYGRTSPSRTDEVAFSYGAGLSWMRTCLVTGTLQTSFIATDPNTHLVPLAAFSVALAIPLLHGRAFGERPMNMTFGEPLPEMRARPHNLAEALAPSPRFHTPKLDLYLGLDLGLLVPLGDTGNRLSLDLGAAMALRARKLLSSVSAADTQRL